MSKFTEQNLGVWNTLIKLRSLNPKEFDSWTQGQAGIANQEECRERFFIPLFETDKNKI